MGEHDINFNINDESLVKSLELVQELEQAVQRISGGDEVEFGFTEGLNRSLLESIRLMETAYETQQKRAKGASDVSEAEKQSFEETERLVEGVGGKQQRLIEDITQNFDQLERRIQQITESSRNMFSSEIVRQIVEAIRFTETLNEEMQGAVNVEADGGAGGDDLVDRSRGFDEYIGKIESLSDSLASLTDNLARNLGDINVDEVLQGFDESYQEFVNNFTTRLLEATGDFETGIGEITEQLEQVPAGINFDDIAQRLEQLSSSEGELSEAQRLLSAVLQARDNTLSQLSEQLENLQTGLSQATENNVDNIQTQIDDVQQQIERIEDISRNVPVTFDIEEINIEDDLKQQVQDIGQTINEVVRNIQAFSPDFEDIDTDVFDRIQGQISDSQRRIDELSETLKGMTLDLDVEELDLGSFEQLQLVLDEVEDRIGEIKDATLEPDISLNLEDFDRLQARTGELQESLRNLQLPDLGDDLGTRRETRVDVDTGALENLTREFAESVEGLNLTTDAPDILQTAGLDQALIEEIRNGNSLLEDLIQGDEELDIGRLVTAFSEEIGVLATQEANSLEANRVFMEELTSKVGEVQDSIIDSATMITTILTTMRNIPGDVGEPVPAEVLATGDLQTTQENVREVERVIQNLAGQPQPNAVEPTKDVLESPAQEQILRQHNENNRVTEQLIERVSQISEETNLRGIELPEIQVEAPGDEGEGESLRDILGDIGDMGGPETETASEIENLETVNNNNQGDTTVNINIEVNGDLNNRETYERMAKDIEARLKEAIRTSYGSRGANV